MFSILKIIIKKCSFFLLVLALFFLSCQSNSSKKLISELPDSGSLLSKEITLDSTVLIPSKILLFPDMAVIFDNGKEALFKVYSLPDLSFLYSFGEKGEGPDEFHYLDVNSMQTINNDLMLVSGSNIRKIRIEEDKPLMGESVELLLSYASPVNRLLMINDSTYISDVLDAKPGGPEHQMVHLSRAEEIATFGKYAENPTSENMNQSDFYRNFMKTTVVNPKDGRLAAFYIHQNQIKFYSPHGELVREIEVEIPLKNVSEEEMNLFRAEGYATSAHIFVLYLGVPKSVVMEQSDTFRPHLEIWDWDGNLLERFMLDQLITTFAVSEKYQKIYGLSFFKEDVLFEYDLKDGVQPNSLIDKNQEGNSTKKDKKTKKQDQITNPYSEIIAENDYYKMKLPVGWNYTAVREEVKKDFYETDDMYITKASFRSPKPDGKSFCDDASVQVRIFFPKEEAFDIGSHLDKIIDDYRSNSSLINLNVKALGSDEKSKGYRLNYANQLVDSKGNKYISYSEVDIFERENKIIRTSFRSCNLFEHYYEEVQEALSTLTLKDAFPNEE